MINHSTALYVICVHHHFFHVTHTNLEKFCIKKYYLKNLVHSWAIMPRIKPFCTSNFVYIYVYIAFSSVPSHYSIMEFQNPFYVFFTFFLFLLFLFKRVKRSKSKNSTTNLPHGHESYGGMVLKGWFGPGWIKPRLDLIFGLSFFLNPNPTWWWPD